MVVFLNGQFVPESQAMIPVTDRGFLYGDGLFETMRVFNGRPFRMAQHLERMVRGATYLNIPMPYSPKELQRFAEQLIQENQTPDAVLRVTLTRGPGPRGYSPKNAGPSTLVMSLHPAEPLQPAAPPRWSMITSTLTLPANDPLCSFKTLNKLVHITARAQAEARNADEALLLNTNGEVTEASGANLFWIYREKVCTPPTGRGALPGITRAVILEICQVLGLPTNKRVIKREALRNADAIFLSQSALGMICIENLDGEPVPDSPLVEKIYRTYCEMLAQE